MAKSVENVFIITFDNNSLAYQAFSRFKNLHAEKLIVGEQMAVVHNDIDAGLQLKDFLDFTGADKTAKGSIIGLLVGIIGGPLGMLLGWIGGSVIGATGDAREVRTAVDVFEETLSLITPETTGLVLIAREQDKPLIDKVIYDEIGGQVARLDGEYVRNQIKEARAAERELQQEARKRWYNK